MRNSILFVPHELKPLSERRSTRLWAPLVRTAAMTVAEDVQRPVKAIRALYERRGANPDEDFGVKQHFTALVASGAQVRPRRFQTAIAVLCP